MQSVIDVPGVPVGAPAPLVELESLDGERVTLGEPSATGTLVLFWNPGCGYCRAIHEDVLAWERSAGGGPRLVVVSSGDPERNREDGFRSTVLLDSRFAAGEAFGAGGTPAAILLDADGRVASGVAVGAPAVLALAGDAARAIGLEV
jgi:protein-disulfide isomerase